MLKVVQVEEVREMGQSDVLRSRFEEQRNFEGNTGRQIGRREILK
jgi:hypothetical protein